MIATLHFLYMKENGTVVSTEMALVTFCCFTTVPHDHNPIGSAWRPLSGEKDA
jgi:hypothetical protein